MIIMKMFYLEDEKVEELSKLDMHPEDLGELIDDGLVWEDPEQTWHFTDMQGEQASSILDKIYNRTWDEEK